jgi:predicted RNA-binding Zn ribbon-like protein
MEYTMTFDPNEREHGRDHDHKRHGHQAALQDGLDFVNTLEHGRTGDEEHLPDLPAAVRWFDEHELLHREMVAQQLANFARDPHAAAPVMARIRRVRAALRELLDATVEHRPADPGALRHVNQALRSHYVYELVPAPDGVSLDHRHEGDPIVGALARLSESIARELNSPDSERLRVCENSECRWVFHDNSPGGRRKWCDMSTCGNRAKVARHRARQRAQAGDDAISASTTVEHSRQLASAHRAG